MDALKDKEVALLCIRNLNRYLEGDIRKEEWEENLRRIQEMIGEQQSLPFNGEGRVGPYALEAVSDN
jgi:hypothetical protein